MTFFLFVLVGIILILSELFIPMFGFMGLLGLALVIMGSSLAYDPSLTEYGIAMIFACSLALALVIGGGGYVAWKAYRKKTETGKEGMIGDSARVLDWNDKQGRVFVDGENWHAQSEKSLDLKEDDTVRILEMKDLTLIVEPKA